jgi:hypothetical protein
MLTEEQQADIRSWVQRLHANRLDELHQKQARGQTLSRREQYEGAYATLQMKKEKEKLTVDENAFQFALEALLDYRLFEGPNGQLIHRDEMRDINMRLFFDEKTGTLPTPMSITAWHALGPQVKLPAFCNVCGMPMNPPGAKWALRRVGNPIQVWWYGVHHNSCADFIEQIFRQYERDCAAIISTVTAAIDTNNQLLRKRDYDKTNRKARTKLSSTNCQKHS